MSILQSVTASRFEATHGMSVVDSDSGKLTVTAGDSTVMLDRGGATGAREVLAAAALKASTSAWVGAGTSTITKAASDTMCSLQQLRNNRPSQ